ncbi:MAG TPA: hypothetical protein VGS20_05930 [Candidatus Acidoferrales bacterium]|nr:hypothetical protein [Candidatus Acidoferrales bacterium]
MEKQSKATKPEPKRELLALEKEFDQLDGLLCYRAGGDGVRDEFGDVVNGLMAAAYLLDQASEAGNEPVNPRLALGLVHVLRSQAREVGRLYYATLRDLKGLGTMDQIRKFEAEGKQ